VVFSTLAFPPRTSPAPVTCQPPAPKPTCAPPSASQTLDPFWFKGIQPSLYAFGRWQLYFPTARNPPCTLWKEVFSATLSTILRVPFGFTMGCQDFRIFICPHKLRPDFFDFFFRLTTCLRVHTLAPNGPPTHFLTQSPSDPPFSTTIVPPLYMFKY